MGYPLRWNRTDLIQEVTLATIQGRHLLRPSPEVCDVVYGVLSRAQARYPGIRLYGFFFNRADCVLLLSSENEAEISRFMAYVAGGISRRLGRLLGWSGKLWASRYRAVPILDEEAITQRLRHLLSRGVDEGLVASPKDWPGASCVPALLGTMQLEGAWINREREAELRAAGLEPPPSAYVEPYRVVLSPVPAWADLPSDELVARYSAMIDSIEVEHLAKRRGHVLDPIALQQHDPCFPPSPRERRRFSQLCYATCEVAAEAFRASYRQFCAAFRAAAHQITKWPRLARALLAAFPAGSNPRPALRVPLGDRQAIAPSRRSASEAAQSAGAVDTIRDDGPQAGDLRSNVVIADSSRPPHAHAQSSYRAPPAEAAFTAAERARPYGRIDRRTPPHAGTTPIVNVRGRAGAPPALLALSAYRTSRPQFGHPGRMPDIPDIGSRT